MVSAKICWGRKNYFLTILHSFKNRETLSWTPERWWSLEAPSQSASASGPVGTPQLPHAGRAPALRRVRGTAAKCRACAAQGRAAAHAQTERA